MMGSLSMLTSMPPCTCRYGCGAGREGHAASMYQLHGNPSIAGAGHSVSLSSKIAALRCQCALLHRLSRVLIPPHACLSTWHWRCCAVLSHPCSAVLRPQAYPANYLTSLRLGIDIVVDALLEGTSQPVSPGVETSSRLTCWGMVGMTFLSTTMTVLASALLPCLPAAAPACSGRQQSSAAGCGADTATQPAWAWAGAPAAWPLSCLLCRAGPGCEAPCSVHAAAKLSTAAAAVAAAAGCQGRMTAAQGCCGQLVW